MKIIPFETIKGLDIAPAQCVEWVKESFNIQQECILPAKISMHLENNIFFNTMPCVISPLNKMGVKLVSRYPLREPSLNSELLLYEASSGKLLALMDAEWITAMRTGAVAATAIQMLQKSTAHTYAFVGLGNTARATLLCLLGIIGKRSITVKLLNYKDQAELFKSYFEDYSNITFTIVKTSQEFIERSDVIVSCVTAKDDLMGKNEWFEEGVLVVPVHTRGFQNCDLFFDKIFVDDSKHVEGFKNYSQFKYKEELANVLKGIDPGRINNKERILAYNIGISIHDIYFATQIYGRLEKSVLPEISLRQEMNKFWV